MTLWAVALGALFSAALLMPSHDAYAQAAAPSSQQQQTSAQQPQVPAAPPQNQLVPQPLVAQQVAPAPRLEPMLSPQDMAAQQAAQQAAAQKAAEAAAQNQQQAATTQQNTPSNTATVSTQNPAIQQQQATIPVAAPQQQMQQQQQMPATVPLQPPQPQQQLELHPSVLQNQQALQQQAQMQETQIQAQTGPQAMPEPMKATNIGGFAPQAASAQIPVTQGMLPAESVTNPGMDMSINPDMIGGYDPNLPPSPTNPVPYEVQLEQRTQELQQKARSIAFERAKKSALPMETHEIRDVLGRLKDTQEAIQTPVRPAPKPSNVIKTVSTDPSARPQTIHLAAGNVSTMNFVDITGEPWPIVDIGFGGAFDVKPPEAGGHVIRITPLRDFARGNLVVRLLKMTTPLTFSLQSGGDNVYYRFDARIPEYGPNAKMPLIAEGIGAHAGDKVTTSFLEGVPPNGSTKLLVEGIDARTTAYRYSGTMYVRTPLSLLSPAWNSSATSADGMNVYLLQETPVLLLSDKGALVRARISDMKKISAGF